MAAMKFYNSRTVPTPDSPEGTYYVKRPDNSDRIDVYIVSNWSVKKLENNDGKIAQLATDSAVLNISQINNKYDYTSSSARAAVTEPNRWIGREIRYKTASGWVNEQFIGNDITNWDDGSLWKTTNGFDNTEQFLYVLTDNENRIVFAILTDGSVYIPKGIPKEVSDQLVDISKALSDTIALLNGFKGSVIEAITRIDARIPVDGSEEYLYVITDSDNKIVLGIKGDGTVEIPKLQNVLNSLIMKLDSRVERVEEMSPVFEDIDYLYAITDSEGKLLLGFNPDGSVEIPHLKGADLTNIMKDVTLLKTLSDKSPLKEIRIPKPNTIPRVYFDGVTLASVTKDDGFPCKMRYVDDAGNYFEKDILLSYQGSSSMNYHKKNFAIDILNRDGSECKIRVGNWVSQDSFHFKANYIDATHYRNVGVCQLYDKMRHTLPAGQVYPFQPPYDRDITSFPNRFPTGALGHIDGFPIELYLNDMYYGIYTWNLKVHRANFDMKKDNQSQILLKQDSEWGMDFYSYRETDWEFKNPSKPNAIAIASIERLFAWLKAVDEVPDQALFEDTYEDYIYVDSLIDYYLILQLFGAYDCVVKNMTLYTMNGTKWYLGIYDLDTTFGLSWDGSRITEASDQGIVDLRNNALLRIIDRWRKEEIKDRFKFLVQDGGVLSPLNVDAHIYDFMCRIGNENYERDFNNWAWVPLPSAVHRPDVIAVTTSNTGYTQLSQWYRDRVSFLASEWGISLK